MMTVVVVQVARARVRLDEEGSAASRVVLNRACLRGKGSLFLLTLQRKTHLKSDAFFCFAFSSLASGRSIIHHGIDLLRAHSEISTVMLLHSAAVWVCYE